MVKDSDIRKTARASLIDEIQTQAYTKNPHGVPSLRAITIRAAAIQTLADTPEGIPDCIRNNNCIEGYPPEEKETDHL